MGRYSIVVRTPGVPELDVVKGTYSSLKEAQDAVTLGPKFQHFPWRKHGEEYEWTAGANIWAVPDDKPRAAEWSYKVREVPKSKTMGKHWRLEIARRGVVTETFATSSRKDAEALGDRFLRRKNPRRNPGVEVRQLGTLFFVYKDGAPTGKNAKTRAKAEALAAAMTTTPAVTAPAPRAAPAARPAPAPRPTPATRRAAPRAAPVPDRYPVLGGGVIETVEREGFKKRPFVAVRVAPGKVRAFYMSTGTGGQTEAGEWNLFGGIASGFRLGWFIKPHEGKRVEKYADVAAFLTEKFSDNAEEAARRILAQLPGATTYEEHEGSPAAPHLRQFVASPMAAQLNRYLIDLEAIAPFEEQEDEYRPREREVHQTVRTAARVRPAAAPVAAPAGVMLAKPYAGTDPTGWWMSEKLDGVRAYWTGTHFYTRNGNPIHAPEWFTRSLPNIALDGELTAGRGAFQQTVSAVRKQVPVDTEWRSITFQVFDAPTVRGGCEARWAEMNRVVTGVPHVFALQQTRCSSPRHLAQVRAEIAALGGEGVMLREAGSAYEQRRTGALRKVKSFQDAEARITGHTAGTGKHAGRLGAYEAVLLKGSRAKFRIGTGISDAERERPLSVGTIVTVKFQELTDDGVPRFPALVGARDYE